MLKIVRKNKIRIEDGCLVFCINAAAAMSIDF